MESLLHDVRRLHGRMSEGLRVSQDGRRPDPALFQEGQPLGGGPRPEHRHERPRDLLPGVEESRCGGMTRQLGQPERVGKGLERRDGDDDMTVPRLVDAIGRRVEHAGQGRVALLESRPIEEVGDGLDLQIQRRPQHAHLDLEPPPGAAALDERRQHPHGQQRRPVLVDDGRAHRGRRLAGAPRDGGEPRDALHEEVLTRAVAVRARLAVAGSRDVNEPRVDGAGVLPAEPPALEHARPEVLDQHVRPLDEPARDGPAMIRLEVEREAPLVPVREQKERAHAVEVEVAARPVALPQRPPGRLDLDHVGPEVGQELDARGPQQELGEGEDADAGENGQRRAAVGAHSTILRMWVAAATTSPRWVVQVTRAKVLSAASSRSTIS